MLTKIARLFIGGEQEKEIRRLRCEVGNLEWANSALNLVLGDARAAQSQAEEALEAARRERDAAQAELDALRAEHEAKVGGYRGALAEARVNLANTEERLAQAQRERDAARALLSRLAPRTYREGDPRPGGQVVFWYDAKWYPGEGRCLERGRMYIDLPPPWEWPQPQIGGSTPYAVVVLIFVGTRLVVSEYPKRPGCFVLPGGKVETGEAPWAAALRETKEETGRDALIEAEPFFVGESHNGKPMWAYRGVLNGTVPEEWAGPEGRVRLSSIDEVRRHYHPGFLPAFDRVMGAVWPDVLQKVTQERDEIAATLADVAKAKVAAEEALAAAEQVQCDLARERAGAGVSSFSSKNEARGYVCERCGKPCEIEVVREMPRPRSRCCHMPARPAPEPEIDWRAVREAMGAVFAASTEADGKLKDAIGAAWRFLCINNFEDVAQARAQARRLATMANGALQEPINALLRALWVGHG